MTAGSVQIGAVTVLVTLGIGLALTHWVAVKRFFLLPESVAAESKNDVYYPDCRAARVADVAPIHIGEPGYRPELDSNGDGIACDQNGDR